MSAVRSGSPQSFTKDKRLLTAKDFEQVFKACQFRASNRHLLILALPNQQLCARLGLVIAKKHIRLAVNRNRIKRLVRENFRQQQQLPPIDAIVLARKGLDLQQSANIHRQLNQLWQKIRQSANK